MFKKLFANQPVIFKQHRLIHYPTILQQSGPFTHMCVLKYERKHQFFKRLAHQVCNFKNICKTMINRHQLEHFVHWSSSDNSLATEFGPGKWVPSNYFFAIGNLNLFQENFNPEDDKIYECKRAKKLGVCFKVCDVVIINNNACTDMPVFLKIEKLLRVQDQLVFLVIYLKLLNTPLLPEVI